MSVRWIEIFFMFCLLQGKSRKNDHCNHRRNNEERKQKHEENLRKRENRRKEHKQNVEKVEKRKHEHEENVKEVNRRQREHEENVREIEKRREEHNKNVEKINERNEQHENNVREIERRQQEHDENVKEIEKRKQEHDKNVKEIERRKQEHDKNVQKINERNKQHDENVKEIERRNKQHEENVRKWIKANYRRKSGENIEEYYKRICTNNVKNEEEYIERITSVRSLFSDLDLWYDEKYLSETKYYYTLVYSKKDIETEEEYFKRLLTKESYESEENFAKRVNILRLIFPSLAVWYDKEYYDTLTKKFYEALYRKKETETIDAYLNRVYTKYCGESEVEFWKRVLLIQETFPEYEYWYQKEYLDKLEIFKIINKATSESELEELLYSKDEDEQILKAKLQCLRKLFDSSYTRNEEYSKVKLEYSMHYLFIVEIII